MKALHNSFEKQKKQPIHLYNASCSCCCCLLMPLGNWIADKIVIKVSRAKNTKWMTLANVVLAILSSIGSWSLLIPLQIVGYHRGAEIGLFLMMLGFYCYLLFWYSQYWLPDRSNSTRAKFALLQWFLSIIFMTVFMFLSVIGVIGVLSLM